MIKWSLVVGHVRLTKASLELEFFNIQHLPQHETYKSNSSTRTPNKHQP